jgi:hypothetical protein
MTLSFVWSSRRCPTQEKLVRAIPPPLPVRVNVRVLELDVQTGRDAVGNDTRLVAEAGWRRVGLEARGKEQAHTIGSIQVEVVADDRFEEVAPVDGCGEDVCQGRTAQQADEARPYAGVVRDVGIAIHRQPEVRRSEGSPNLYLTFRGLSDARSSVDRDTRLRIVLPAAQAVLLWQLLGENLTDEEKAEGSDGAA